MPDPRDMERQLTRLYNGRTRQSHCVFIPDGSDRVSYTHSTISEQALILIESGPSGAWLREKSGRTVTFQRNGTEGRAGVRFMIVLPDQETM